MMLLPLGASAQNAIKGKVTDKAGETIPGATVLDTDNGNWGLTDINGVFTIEKASKGHNLQATCLGYATSTVVYQGEAEIVIVLQDEALELEETVVIGYGSVKKKDLTGSVGVINNQIIEQQSVTNLSQTLQGAIPGLQVTR